MTGFARAIWPAHSPVDGDLVFSLATGASGITPRPFSRHGPLCSCRRDHGAGDCAGGV